MTNKFNQLLGSLLLLSALLLGGCSDGDGGSNNDIVESPADPDDTAVAGGASKGPLVGAEVNVYIIDTATPDLKGRLIATGTTDDNARITGIDINNRRLDRAFLLEFTGGTDHTTGEAPLISPLRTIMTPEALNSGQSVFATPLTTFTLAYAYQIADVDQSGDVSTLEFLGSGSPVGAVSFLETDVRAAVSFAAEDVGSMFGFGVLDASVDLFLTAPFFDGVTSQADTLDYRSASEAFAALVLLLEQQGSASADEIIQALAEDLADGAIDGQSAGQPLAALEDISDVQGIVSQDPAALMIPGTSRPLAELLDLLSEEAEQLSPSVNPEPLTVPVMLAAVPGTDSDGDRVIDVADACPDDATETLDRDGDTFCDGKDLFPDESTEWADVDGDSVGDNADKCDSESGAIFNYGFDNTDGDTLCALLEGDTYARNLGIDYDDGNGSVDDICDVGANATVVEQSEAGCFADDDGDGFFNPLDNCPAISNPGQENQDSDLGDIFGDACDDDRDGDGVANGDDLFPDDRSGWLQCDDAPGVPATICALPVEITTWVVDNIFAEGTDESSGITEASFELESNVLTGSVSFLSLGGNIAGFTYVGDWVIDLGAQTITATNTLCTDLGPVFSGCGIDPYVLGGSSDQAFVFGTVNVTVVDNGGDTYTVTWESGDAAVNVHYWTFSVQ